MSRTQTLSDADARAVAEAELELDRLLAVEPSAESTARVRARIAAVPPAPGWHWKHLILPLAGVAMLAVFLGLQNAGTGRESGEQAAAPPHHDIVLESAPPEGVAPVVPDAAVTRQRGRHVRGAVVRRPTSPEIVIDPAFAAAIRRLARSDALTSIDATSADQMPEIGQPAALSVAEPLNVPELVLHAAGQSGGQQ